MKRVEVGGHTWSISRPTFMVLVDGDDGSSVVVALHWGTPGCDPVWYVDVILSGTRIGRWVSRVYWPVRDWASRRHRHA